MAELIFVLVWVTFSNKILMLFSFQGVELASQPQPWVNDLSPGHCDHIGWGWPGSVTTQELRSPEILRSPDSIQMWRGECDNDALEASELICHPRLENALKY